MYARGMSTREITAHLHDLYGIDVSPDLISTVTDAILEEVAAWQACPLDQPYLLMLNDEKRDGERGDLHHAALCANSDLGNVPHSVNLGAHGATARRQLRWPVERQL